jgi:DNA-binding transcriptional regulator/RsmH inhibitor MraZ
MRFRVFLGYKDRATLVLTRNIIHNEMMFTVSDENLILTTRKKIAESKEVPTRAILLNISRIQIDDAGRVTCIEGSYSID